MFNPKRFTCRYDAVVRTNDQGEKTTIEPMIQDDEGKYVLAVEMAALMKKYADLADAARLIAKDNDNLQDILNDFSNTIKIARFRTQNWKSDNQNGGQS
jgi:hypothetical protein